MDTKSILILKNAYFDSVTLMKLSNQIAKLPGVGHAMIAMATPINKELMERVDLIDDALRQASPSDLVIAVQAEAGAAAKEAIATAKDLLFSRKKKEADKSESAPRSISEAVERDSDLNLAVISVAGQFAVREVRQAMDNNLNVMLFSDNVAVENELALKRLAHDKGLLLMGPDCGTAIVNNMGLCFANQVSTGAIGLIAASGTGLQEVTVLIDRLGGGVSQALGLGGRDLSADIGGIMMLDCLEALKNDPVTEVIVLVSKPPAKEVAEKVMPAARKAGKPVVVCFVGVGGEADGNLEFADSLEDAAVRAVRAIGLNVADNIFYVPETLISEAAAKLKPEQKYIRGLFCGGTLAAEAERIVRDELGSTHSNFAKKPEYKLADPLKSVENAIVDLGDDRFTQGRPHPMIDPTIRVERLVQEASDLETAVILLDFEIGYGSHEDPVGVTLSGIRAAMKAAEKTGRTVAMVAYVLGTENDYQGLDNQVAMLRAEGVIVCNSNLQAVRAAVAIIKGADANHVDN